MDDTVTDPALIESLNAAKARQQTAPTSPNLGTVTDPDLIAHLNAAKLGQAGEKPPLGQTMRNVAESAIKGIPMVGSQIAVPTAAVTSAALQPVLGTGEDRPTFAERTQANVGKYTPQLQQFEGQHPGEAAALQEVGGAASTLGFGSRYPKLMGVDPTASTLRNVGRAMGFGGVTGAAGSYATGEDPLVGGSVGAGTMAAGPVIGKGIGLLTQKAADLISPANRGLLGNLSPEALGIALKISRAEGLTDAQIANKINELGAHGFLAEYGPSFAAGTADISASTPAGRTIIENAFNQRTAGARGRIEDAITNAFGPRVNIADLTEKSVRARSAASDSLYNQWRQAVIPPTPKIEDLYPRLESAGVLSEAQQNAGMEGLPWDVKWFTKQPGGNISTSSYPTAQSWDNIKRTIDDKIRASKDEFGRNTNKTRILTGIKNDLLDAIKESNSYGAQIWEQARQAWGDETSLMRARQAGQDAWLSGTRRDELEPQLRGYSGPERTAFNQGARDSLSEKMDASRRGDTQTRDMLLAPANQDKVHFLTASQPGKAQPLLDAMQHEVGYAGNKSDIVGNSRTAQRALMHETLKPQPTWLQTVLGNEAYSPHVQPQKFIPFRKMLVDASKQAQASRHEAALGELAPMMTSQGTQAQAYARALNSLPTSGASPGAVASRYATMLSQGSLPPAIRYVRGGQGGPVATPQ